MARLAYSYIFKQEILLLNEEEFLPIEKALSDFTLAMKSYRQENGVVNLKATMKDSEEGELVLRICEKLSGVRPFHPLGARDLKLSNYGGLCSGCKKPYRTPRAKVCIECGFELPAGQIAGPLSDG